MTKPIKLTALQGAEVLPQKKNIRITSARPLGKTTQMMNALVNETVESLSQVGVVVADEFLEVEIKEYENEIAIEQFGGNVVKEAQARGIVMGLRIAKAELASTASQWIRLERIV